MSNEENETAAEEVKWGAEEELNWHKKRQEVLEDRIRTLESALTDALYPDTDSNTVAHAKRELELAGLLTEDGDFYGGMTGKAVLELVKVFARQGHSGMSAGIVVDIFSRVAMFETLTDNDHSLHHDISEYYPTDGEHADKGPHLQDIRDSKWFSNDGGETWYNVYDKINVGEE